MDGYYYGLNEDGISGWEGPYDSREEAEDFARDEYGAEEGSDRPTHFYTAKAVPHVPDLGDLGQFVIERVAGSLLDPPFENSGPWDDWPPASQEDWARLDSLLSHAVRQWLDERCLWPAWHVFEDIRRHEMDEAGGPDHVIGRG